MLEDDIPGETGQDDDVYDEFGQEVIKSQANDEVDENEDIVDETNFEQEMEVDGDAEVHSPAPGGVQHEENDDGAQENAGAHHIVGTQHTGVANSQLGPHEEQSRLPSHQIDHPSSITSFVPGSQYTGKTSQEQALLRSKLASSNTRRQVSQTEDQDDARIPSSPPLPSGNANQEKAKVGADLEIPESDLPLPEETSSKSSNLVDSNGKSGSNEGEQILFSTAQTHLSRSGNQQKQDGNAHVISPVKKFMSQQSAITSQSPRTAAGVRHFAEIAADPSPPNASGESQVDVDAIMGDVLGEDDDQFNQAMSSQPPIRPSKRRKVDTRYSSTNSNSDNVLEVVQVASQPIQAEIEENGEAEKAAVSIPLQENASRGNELCSTTPDQEVVPESTPDSVKEREGAGAKAASQLLSRRSSKKARPLRQYSSAKKKRVKSNETNFPVTGYQLSQNQIRNHVLSISQRHRS